MPVPNSFANVTTSIPLSQLDANFDTPITLGNTAIQLGNTVTTLNNMTLANVTISTGNVTLTNATVTTANVTTANIGTEIVTTSQTLNYGTANGVVYLNASKVSTTGTALVFDGTNLGVGGTSAGAKLSVNKGASGAIVRLTDGTQQSLDISSNAGAGSAGTITYDAVNGAAHVWSIGNTERMRINAGAPILCLSGGNTSATGTGIAFPATQSASSDANTLDDYEEGTWTPSLSSTGASFTYPRGQYGMYVKVGQLVFAQFYIGASATGTTSNSCSISGLPFTSNNLNALAQSSVSAWVDQTTSLGFTVDVNNTTIAIWRQNVGGASLATAAQVAGGYIVGHAMYRTGS